MLAFPKGSSPECINLWHQFQYGNMHFLVKLAQPEQSQLRRELFISMINETGWVLRHRELATRLFRALHLSDFDRDPLFLKTCKVCAKTGVLDLVTDEENKLPTYLRTHISFLQYRNNRFAIDSRVLAALQIDPDSLNIRFKIPINCLYALVDMLRTPKTFHKTPFKIETVPGLLEVSHKNNIPYIFRSVEKNLLARLTKENCHQFAKLGDRWKFSFLKAKAEDLREQVLPHLSEKTTICFDRSLTVARLVINKRNLQILEASWSQEFPTSDAELFAMENNFSGILRLEINGKISEDGMTAITHLPYLRELNIACDLDSSILSVGLGRMPQLRTLEITAKPLGFHGNHPEFLNILQNLPEVFSSRPELHKLTLCNTNYLLGEREIDAICMLTELRILILYQCRVADPSFYQKLSQLPKLKYLMITEESKKGPSLRFIAENGVKITKCKWGEWF